MIVRQFRATDLDGFDAYAPVMLTAEQANALEKSSSWTVLEGDKPVMMAGVVRLWDGRFQAWAYMGRYAGPRMRPITKAVLTYLEGLNARRVELSVAVGFAAGHRWAKLLGFELETPRMAGYAPDGADHAMYVRMRR